MSLRRFATGILQALIPFLISCGAPEAGGTVSGADCNPELTYASFGRSFLQEYCTECHSGMLEAAARHGAPSDHNFDTLAAVQANHPEHMDQVAAAGPDGINTAMPPKGYPQPSEAERTQLGQWLACGAP
jgi:uncharacterized membrane protein